VPVPEAWYLGTPGTAGAIWHTIMHALPVLNSGGIDRTRVGHSKGTGPNTKNGVQVPRELRHVYGIFAWGVVGYQVPAGVDI